MDALCLAVLPCRGGLRSHPLLGLGMLLLACFSWHVHVEKLLTTSMSGNDT